MSPVDEDAIDEAANDFQEKGDGQKGRKTRTGGRHDKVGFVCILSLSYVAFSSG